MCGYKRAGDVLVENALTERFDRPNLIFPALFSYRHYVELALKAVIQKHGAFAGVYLVQKNHRLPELWTFFLQIAVAFGNEETEQAVVAVGKCIAEIDCINAGSTTFRYARNLKGDVPGLPKDGLDLVRLRDVMNGISNFLEAAHASFDALAESAVEEI